MKTMGPFPNLFPDSLDYAAARRNQAVGLHAVGEYFGSLVGLLDSKGRPSVPPPCSLQKMSSVFEEKATSVEESRPHLLRERDSVLLYLLGDHEILLKHYFPAAFQYLEEDQLPLEHEWELAFQ